MYPGQILRSLINAFKNHSSFFFLQVSTENTEIINSISTGLSNDHNFPLGDVIIMKFGQNV